MAKTKKRPKTSRQHELDSVYVLKLALYLIVGSQWLRLYATSGRLLFSIPFGVVIGLLFAWHDHFRIDRKIEFAVLLIAAFVGYFAQVGFILVTSSH